MSQRLPSHLQWKRHKQSACNHALRNAFGCKLPVDGADSPWNRRNLRREGKVRLHLQPRQVPDDTVLCKCLRRASCFPAAKMTNWKTMTTRKTIRVCFEGCDCRKDVAIVIYRMFSLGKCKNNKQNTVPDTADRGNVELVTNAIMKEAITNFPSKDARVTLFQLSKG